MASYTTNLNLKKPAGNENVSIGDINNNMDAIDQAYGTMSGKVKKISQGSVTLLRGSPTTLLVATVTLPTGYGSVTASNYHVVCLPTGEKTYTKIWVAKNTGWFALYARNSSEYASDYSMDVDYIVIID